MPLHTLQTIEETIAFQKNSKGGLVSPKLAKEFGSVLEVNGQACVPFLGYKAKNYSGNELKNAGFYVSTEIGDVISFKVPLLLLENLFNITELRYIEIPQPIYPELDVLVEDTRTDSVYIGIGLPQSYTGKDVIVGVIDWGFDFNHPVFYDSLLNRNRIIACWDHWKKSGPAPQPFGYGTVYYGFDELMAAGSDTANNRGYDTHGTHVAGIAGSGGAGINLRGVAPECNFLFIQVDWNAGSFVDGVEWMRKIADDLGKRLVINMSFGSYHRANLDTSSFFHTVAKEYNRKGFVLVTSAGNNGGNQMHIRKDFRNDTLRTQVSMLPNTTTFSRFLGHRVIMWGEPKQGFKTSFSIHNITNQIIYQSPFFDTKDWKKNLDTFAVVNNDTLFYKLEMESSHPLNQKPYASFVFVKQNNTWKIGLHATANQGVVHFWNVIQNTIGTSNTGQPFIALLPGWVQGDNNYTCSDPGVTPEIITVAAHNSQITNSTSGEVFPGVIANFSSRGPTLDGLVKPDISAPGVNILSSVSSFTTNDYQSDLSTDFQNKRYDFARFSGTSMSGPAVAGVAALLLEANPKLTHAQIHAILMETAREDIRTGELPSEGNNTWGKGKVVAINAVLRALELDGELDKQIAKPGILYPNPTRDLIYYRSNYLSEMTASVYDMQGKKVVQGMIGRNSPLNVSKLQSGVYYIRIQDKNQVVLKFLVY